MFQSFYYSRKHGKKYVANGNHLVCEDEKVPIIDKIPRFVTINNYAAAFGDQWNRFAKTQLDSYSGLTITEQRVERCFGGYEALRALQGKTILEAGCGAGRFTEILLKNGAIVVSVDLSHAVEANQNNFPQNDNHLICQADINQLPFQENSFDFVMCLGVIQHTELPERTIEQLFRYLRPGGKLVIDHYRPTLSFFTRLLPVYRLLFKLMKPGNTLAFCEKLVDFFLPLHRMLGRTSAGFALLSRVSPIVTYFHSLPALNDVQQREWAILDTHDSLFDYYKHLRTKEAIIKILQKINAREIRAWKGGNGIEAYAIK